MITCYGIIKEINVIGVVIFVFAKVVHICIQSVLLAEKVAPYNRLRGGVTFIEKVPRSPSGKILRRQLRDETLGKLNVTSKL